MHNQTNTLGRHSRRFRGYWLLTTFIGAGCVLMILSNHYFTSTSQNNAWILGPSSQTRPHETASHLATLVVAAQLGDSLDWLNDVPDWPKAVYVTNDKAAEHPVLANKGREGMAYLTYIIENYDTLPSVMIFSHSARYQWHNDDPLYDGMSVLNRLNLSHVQSEGYISLRCAWVLGCPAEIHPFEEAKAPWPASDPKSKDARAGSFYKEAFEELFPDVAVPEVIGAPCCAQFAATAKKIRERPVEDYKRYRDWLLRTDLRDDLSGRILEYSWHIIFNKPAVHCPNASVCYCKLFDLCGLRCETDGACGAAYTLPKFSTLPDGWPEYDWEHRWRNVTELRLNYEHENRNSPGVRLAGK